MSAFKAEAKNEQINLEKIKEDFEGLESEDKNYQKLKAFKERDEYMREL